MDVKGFLTRRQAHPHTQLGVRLSMASVALGMFCGDLLAKPSNAARRGSDFGKAEDIVLSKGGQSLGFGQAVDISTQGAKKTGSVRRASSAQKSKKTTVVKKVSPATRSRGQALRSFLKEQGQPTTDLIKQSSQKTLGPSNVSKTPALDQFLNQSFDTKPAPDTKRPAAQQKEGSLLKEFLGVEESPDLPAQRTPASQPTQAKVVKSSLPSSRSTSTPAVAFLDLPLALKKKTTRTPSIPSSTSTVKDQSANVSTQNFTLPSNVPQAISVASPKAASADRGPKRAVPSMPLLKPSEPTEVQSGKLSCTLSPEVILVTPLSPSVDKPHPENTTEESQIPEIVVVEDASKSSSQNPDVTKVAFQQPPQEDKTAPQPSKKTAPEILEVSNNAFSILTQANTTPIVKTSVDQKEIETPDSDASLLQTEAYKALPAVVIETKASPTLTFSGDICTYLGTVSQDDARDDHEGTMHLGMGWGNFGLNIQGEANASVQYGYHGTIEAIPGSSIGMKENFGEVITPYGVVQFGNVDGVETAFIEDSAALSNGTGAADGSYQDLFNMPVCVPSMTHLMGYTKKATKLSYYSPRWQGFQLGMSYCPNPHHVGWGSLGDASYTGMNGNDDPVFNTEGMKKRHNLALGINYEQGFSDVSVKASLVGLRENTKIKIDVPQTIKSENVNNAFIEYTVPREIQLKSNIAYQASGSISYKGLKLAGGWIDNGSLNLPNSSFDAEKLGKPGLWLGDGGKGWNIGGECSFGCMAVSLAHNKIHRKVTPFETAQGKLNSLGVEAQVIPGIKLFAEVMHIDAETTPRASALYENAAPVKNKGTVVMIGSKVSF